MSTKQTTDTADLPEFDLEILDRSLDDIEELPGFDVPPVGTYQLLLSAETKMIPPKEGEKEARPVVALQYEITGTIKLADKGDAEPIPGSSFGEMFILGNEFGESSLKKAIAPYASYFNTNNLRELVKEKIQNVVITATVKHRFNRKTDPLKENPFAQVVNVVIA